MKNGDTRRGPFSCRMIAVSAMPLDAADARTNHHAGAGSGLRSSPASSRHRSDAWVAAHIAKTMKSSTLRCSFGSIQWSGLKLPSGAIRVRGTAQAMRAGRSGDVERFDLADAALARNEAPPRRFDAAAERRQHAQSGDDNTPHQSIPARPARSPVYLTPHVAHQAGE